MGACVTLTKEICNLITINEEYNNQLEKERVRETLNKNEYGSVFGHTKTETTGSSENQATTLGQAVPTAVESMQRQSLLLRWSNQRP